MGVYRSWVLTLLAAGGSVFSIEAQNLVPNPGFEMYSRCPGNYSEIIQEFRATGWQSANLGTPDLFNSCSAGEADVPHNWAGVSAAREGNGYAGIYLWMLDKQYREYLQCKLKEPLLKDSVYHVEFYYKLSSYSKYSIDRIGLALSDQLISARHDAPIDLTPTLSVIQDSALTVNTGLWETASLKYKAFGGEQFLIIGNFFDNESTKSYKIISRPVAEPMLEKCSYYYIDDVKVIPEYKIREMILAQKISEFSLADTKLNTNYILKNIQFAFNSYRLVPPSFDELDKVASYMIRNPKIMAQLFGHTDDQGSEKYNLKLSQDRAKNVAAYLSSVGINPSRIEVFGYGKRKPLIEGITEEARAVNRRVEVKFIE